jgi:hypothetical protein
MGRSLPKIVVLILLLVSVFLLTSSTFIFGSEREFTLEEVDLLKKTTRMRVVVNASSWLEKPEDIRSAIIEKLVEFTIVPDWDMNYDATIFVDYKETVGRSYGIYGIGSAYTGTEIRCVVKIDHNKVGIIFERSFNSSTSSSVRCPFGVPDDNVNADLDLPLFHRSKVSPLLFSPFMSEK